MRRAAVPLAAVAVAVFAEGGYSTGARFAFAATALVGLAITRPSLQDSIVRTLIALGVLGLVSVTWTEGLEDEALAWGAVTLGYAALVAMGRDCNLETVTTALVVIAGVTAALGLGSALIHESQFAVPVAGDWRPAGPFEYPPALALLQVSVLPILIRKRNWVGLALAVAVLLTADSRTALALAILVVVPRRWILPGAAVAIVAGIFAFGTNGDLLHGRTTTWEAAIETFADDPLKGAGADAFLTASAQHQQGQTIAFAHNLPLELAAELGIVGLALILTLYALSARLIWRQKDHVLAVAAGAFLVSNLLDWPWHLAGSGAVWAMAVGLLTRSDAQEQNLPQG